MNEPNIKKRICRYLLFTLLLCLASLSQAAVQTPSVSVEAENVTVKELLRRIEANSQYTFAYVDSDINLGRRVSVKARDRRIDSILAEVLPEVSAEIKGLKIVLSVRRDQPSAPVVDSGRKVTGRVTDASGTPIVGAAVIVKGTTIGTVVGSDGTYSLCIKEKNAVLEFSLIGYNRVEMRLSEGQTRADAVLASEAIAMDNIVVVGYGVQNKRDVTTSIASIKAEDFADMPTSDFRDAMAAKMPGVQVLQLGGQPDGNVSIRVRGIQSATAGNDPLYVIDGVPCDARAFANLDGGDIESLEVLKDASAAAIYGSRGSCGVILITTKRGGASERPAIRYDGQYSISGVLNKMDVLNAYEFAQLHKESRDGAYLSEVEGASIDDPYEDRPKTYHRVNPLVTAYLQDQSGTLTDTDWQDAIFRTASSTKHSLSVSGKSKTLNYYIGMNYLYREGTIIGSDFERYGIRTNLDGKRNRLKYGVSFSPSYSKTNYVASDAQYGSDGVIASALMAPPVFPVYNDNGSYNWDMNGYLRCSPWDTQTTEVLNPVALALEIDDVREKFNVLGNVYVSYEFVKGLEYKFMAGGDYYSYIRNYYRPSGIPLNGFKNLDALSDPEARNWTNSYFHWTISNQLSFNRQFGDHSISAVAVYEAEKSHTKTSQIYGKGKAGDDNIRTTKGKTIDQDNTYNNEYAYTFASWLLRAQYSYKGRYMISASIRGDGSSRFAPDTRWGHFSAASVGWRISDEAFMLNSAWIDDIKIRASVGQTGNAQIGNSEYLALYGTSNLDLGNGIIPSIHSTQIANRGLGWEKNTQYNLGLDVSLWKGTFQLTADFYRSKTTDMLLDVPVSSVSGHTTSNMNIGSIENKGVELVLSSRRRFGDFTYAFSANWTLNRNKVLNLGDENADIIKEASYEGAYYLTRVGQPIGSYFLLVQDGIFHNQQELDSYPHFETTTVGDFRFVDANGNGILEKDADRVVCGNYMPDFYYGFSLNLSYKGLDLNANFQGVFGNEILNLERRYLLNITGSSNNMREALQRYPYGELNRANRKSTGNVGACTSTFHLEDGSYLRLQNLSLGYTFPDKWTRRIGMSKLRIYVQGTNLFTWTDYTGYNPEVNNNASDALRPGEDYCSYPLSRSFSVGINFNL